MKKLLILIAFLSIQQLFSQMSATEEAYLGEIMVKKVNLLRNKKGIHPLKRSTHLAEAAKLQSDFMSSNNSVTHVQEEELYKTALKRVRYFTTDFDNVGENILSTRRINPPFVKRKLNLIANLIFNSWKKSPDFYKNMISNSFTYSDFGFTYNPTLKQIFATHVFGDKEYKVSNQLSEFAFGIKTDINNCNNLSKEYTYLTTNLANSISIENDEVILKYDHINDLSKILIGENDGFAIDLVTREQLQCNTPNKLDASPIYDGILLKPIYKNDLFATNKAENDQEFIVSLGKVPAFLKNKEISPNLIILKENSVCSYRVPIAITGNRFHLMTIEPKFEVPYIDLLNQGIYIAKEVFFEFDTSKSTTEKYTQANFDLDNVHSFDIKSYTSIDGSENANKIIQNKRADFIKKHIGDVLGFSLDFTKINIDAKENWPLFDYQLELHGYKDQLNSSKKAKRAFANGTLKSSWDAQFTEQRKSKLIAFQHGYWNRNNKQHGFYNLLNGLITDNVHLVNKSLIHLYNQKEVNYDLNKDFILDKLLKNKDLVQNVSALFTKNIDTYNLDYVVYFINYWLTRSESLTAEAQKNLLNLYTHTTFKVLQNWNEDSKNVARILHPDNVETLFKVYKAKSTIDALHINYHMAKIEYFNKVNQKDKIQESFDFVTTNFKNSTKIIEDKVALASFFNVWNSYDTAKQLLLEEYSNDNLNEEATFMLAKILIADVNKNEEIFAKVQEKAIFFNKERWCNWITKDFQNLRLKNIKQLYCASCNKE